MLDEGNTGVTTGDSASSAPSESAVVPQTTGADVNSNTGMEGTPPASTDESAAPPAADQIPENDDDLANLSETERTPLINQRNRIRELNKWRTGAEPVMSWVEERGGIDYVRQDAELVDKFYSPNHEDRTQFYQALAQDTAAFERFMMDVTTDPTVQERVLRNIDPQYLLQHVEQSGLLPEGYGSNIDPAVLATIPNELQEVFRSLPIGVQEQYADLSADVRNWNLRRDAQLYQSQKAEQQRTQQARQAQQQARQQAVYEQKTKVYQDVRSIIQSALAEKLPGSDEGIGFVLNATEAALAQDPEGMALWNEIDSFIENGQMRELRQKLPLVIAKAKAIATQKAAWLNERESKARQFDELMRLGSPEEIMAAMNRIRGGMKQPGPGTTPAPTNGHVPKPDAIGRYDRANILSYHPAHRQ